MNLRSVDTRLWSLTAAVVAAASVGCGGGGGGDTDGGGGTESGGEHTEGPDTDADTQNGQTTGGPTTGVPETDLPGTDGTETDGRATEGPETGETGEPDGCGDGGPCGPGDHCEDGVCVEDPCDYGCCDPDRDCDWNECDEAECGLGELCPYDDSLNKVFCEPLPEVGSCGRSLSFSEGVVFEDATAVVQEISFVGAEDGDGEDLVVGLADGAVVVHAVGSSTTLVLDPPGTGRVATSADLDDDGDTDLVLAIEDANGAFHLATLLNNDAGGYTPAFTLRAPGDVVGLAALHRADAEPGLAMSSGDGSFYRYDGNGGVLSGKDDWAPGVVVDFVAADADGAGDDDLAFDAIPTAPVYLLLDGAVVDAGLDRRGARSLAFGRNDAGATADLYIHTPVEATNWTLLEVVTAAGTEARAFALLETTTFGGVGDLDGDGSADFVLAAGNGLVIVWGDPTGGLGCADTVAFDATGKSIAVGDWAGAGQARIAIADPTQVVVLDLL